MKKEKNLNEHGENKKAHKDEEGMESEEESKPEGSDEDINEAQDVKQESIAELLKEKNEINEKYLRLAADFQNYKRRVENDKKEIFSYANETIVTELLNVLDNFERAIESDKSNETTLIEGIQMIYKQLSEILCKYNLKEIDTENCEFDPNFHHAVMKESVDYAGSNMIIEVFQKGYTFNGKVIRPSMVKVSE